MVKIRSETAEIFLIWTNVARTNVACKNGQQKFWVQNSLGEYKFWAEKISPPKDFGPNNWVKIGSVKVEIFLIWTNVA